MGGYTSDTPVPEALDRILNSEDMKEAVKKDQSRQVYKFCRQNKLERIRKIKAGLQKCDQATCNLVGPLLMEDEVVQAAVYSLLMDNSMPFEERMRDPKITESLLGYRDSKMGRAAAEHRWHQEQMAEAMLSNAGNSAEKPTPAPMDLQAAVAALNSALNQRKHGQEHFAAARFAQAKDCFRAAVAILETAAADDPANQSEIDRWRATNYNNLGAACLQLGEFSECIDACSKVVEAEAGNVKALYRRGRAHAARAEHARARADFERALRIEPWNLPLQRALRALHCAASKAQREEAQFSVSACVPRAGVEGAGARRQHVRSRSAGEGGAAGAPRARRVLYEAMMRFDRETHGADAAVRIVVHAGETVAEACMKSFAAAGVDPLCIDQRLVDMVEEAMHAEAPQREMVQRELQEDWEERSTCTL